MGLSEREQQLLDELERSLLEGKPSDRLKEPNSLRGSSKSVIFGVIILLAGLGLVLAGVMSRQVLVGILGFGVMLWGLYLAFKPTNQ